MKELKFKKIDAFTKGTASGNPAGYIYLDNESLSEAEMQLIASQLKGFVNEAGFLTKTGNSWNLKFYSSECQVPFCGHATIAIMYDLLSTMNHCDDEVFIDVKAGRLPVFNRIKQEDAVYIMAPEPTFLNHKLTAWQIADILGIDEAEISDELPIRLIDGGLRTLIVPLKSLNCCLKMFPDQERLKHFSINNNFDIVLTFVDETSTGSKYRTRVFAPKYGYLEDPATGSGNSAFGYYLMDENLWEEDFTIEQGPSLNNPNHVKLKKYSKDGRKRILFGGSATTRITGSYLLHG